MARRSIETDTFTHENPIPVATRIGPLVTSGVIPPYDPGTRDTPDRIEDQVANLFTHIGAALVAAGASWQDVAKISFYANDPSARGRINPLWEQQFPDRDSSPSRHTHISGGDGPPRISCEFIAYVAD